MVQQPQIIRLNLQITPSDLNSAKRSLRTVFVADSSWIEDQGVARKVGAIAKLIANRLRNIASKVFRFPQPRATQDIQKGLEDNVKLATLLPLVNENPNITISDERIRDLQNKLNNTERPALERLLRRAVAGQITEKQLRNWFSRYENVVRASDAQNDRQKATQKLGQGNVYAFRLMDEHAEHCEECIMYAQKGVTTAKLLPNPTERCSYNLSCKCTIFFGSLSEMVRGRRNSRSARTGVNL